MTDGFSGAEITSVVNTAVSLVLQEYSATFPKPEDAKKHAMRSYRDYETLRGRDTQSQDFERRQAEGEARSFSITSD